jgi:mannose-6-phosphate isomerase
MGVQVRTTMKTLIVKKPWGLFKQFTLNEKSTVKILVVHPGELLSLQSHKKRSEFWYVIQGSPTIVLNTSRKKYEEGDEIKVGKRVKHRILNTTKTLVRILEIASGEFDEKDIVRYEDKYARVKK